MNENTLFHLGLTKDIKAKYAILPGDPQRVEKIAKYLQNPLFVTQKREFVSYIGQINGENVLVTSTGIGGASASIAVEELNMLGVKYIIRVGTCGGMSSKVNAGDIIIPTGSVRMEGTTKEYIPVEYPAVPDFDVLCALVDSAKSQDYVYHTGVVHCKDSFYGQHNPESMPNSTELLNKWQSWIKAGVLASEMETASIFTVSAIRGIKSGAVLLALWNQELSKNTVAEVTPDTSIAIKTAVDAIKLLIERNK